METSGRNLDGNLERSAPPRNLEGAVWMIGSSLLFTVFLVLTKTTSATYDPGFLAFWRAAIALIVLIPIAISQGRRLITLKRPGLIFLRSMLGTLGFALSFYAVSDAFGLPLSEYNAISFSRALFVTIFAAVLLKEVVGKHRWAATGVGFLGVLIMAQPQSGVSMGTVLAILSALFLAGAITLVKSLSEDHSPMTLLFWASLLSSVLLLPVALWNWPDSAPSLHDWGAISAIGICGVVAQYCYIRALSIGDASFLSPMDYVRLPLAAMADLILFRLLPGLWVWVGTAIIIGATLYIVLRERHLKLKETALDKKGTHL